MYSTKMTMTVPEAIAADRGVRPAISTRRVSQVLKELSEAGVEMAEKPLDRQKESAAQVRGGSVDELVSLLRNFGLRQRSGLKLAQGEQKSYDMARQALASEIALVKDISEGDAGALIDTALAG
jgi:RNA polymerase-interacting CarD/CdnL/TRCF family regulator